MPRKPVPCSRCGEPTKPGKGSLPNPTCRPCRRAVGERKAVCQQCGDTFTRVVTPSKGEPKFCSSTCRYNAMRADDPVFPEVEVAPPLWLVPKPLRLSRYNESDPEYRQRLKDRMRLARKQGFSTGSELLAFLHERDDGICGLCGEAVDLDAERPMCPSPDHIVPRCRFDSDSCDLRFAGLNPDVLENLQLSHLQCNWNKNARMPDEAIVQAVMKAMGIDAVA